MKYCIKIIHETSQNEQTFNYSIPLTKREIDVIIPKLELDPLPNVSYEILSVKEMENEVFSLLIDNYLTEKFVNHSNNKTPH